MRANRTLRCMTALAVMGLMAVLAAGTAFAGTTKRKITSIHITVSDSLRDLDPDDDIPSVSSGDFTVPDNDQYEVDDADWYDNVNSLKVGSTPKVEIYLSSQYKDLSNGDEIEYYFSGSYSSSSVSVTGGTFVSASRESNDSLRVVIALKGVKGQYETPDNPVWSGSSTGLAVWEAPENTSGYYSVSLYRNNSRLVVVKTNGRSLNLYPWMDREGDYTFEVRTIPYTAEQEKYGETSDETSSDVLSINDSNKSNGTGKYNTAVLVDQGTAAGTGVSGGNTTTDAGWFRNNNIWYFKYPNGQLITGSWLKWKELWYHFDTNGAMQTGWQLINGRYYYFKPSNGDMKVGWLYLDGNWYYMNPARNTDEGTRYTGTTADIGGKTYYFDVNGVMKTGWITMTDTSNQPQYYYFYPQTESNGNNYGYLARSTSVDGFQIDASGRWVH